MNRWLALITITAALGACASTAGSPAMLGELRRLNCRNPEIVVAPGEARRFAYIGVCAHVIEPAHVRSFTALVSVQGESVTARRIPDSWHGGLHRTSEGRLRWFSTWSTGAPRRPELKVYEASGDGGDAELRAVLDWSYTPNEAAYVAGVGCGLLVVSSEDSQPQPAQRIYRLTDAEPLTPIEHGVGEVLFWSPAQQAFVVERQPGPVWGAPQTGRSGSAKPMPRSGLAEFTCAGEWRPLNPSLAAALAQHTREIRYFSEPSGPAVLASNPNEYGDLPYAVAVLEGSGWRTLYGFSWAYEAGHFNPLPLHVVDVAFSDDGSRFALYRNELGDGWISVFETRSGRELMTAPAGENPRLGLASGGRELVTVHDGGGIRILNVPEPKPAPPR